METKKEVLFLGWASRGRDIDIDMPIMYFFEKVLKWKVTHITIFNLPKILKIKPDIVFMTNTTGGVRQVEIARLVKKSGFKFFSHVSEGMFRKNAIEEFVWGWNNPESGMNETLSMLWSKKSLDLALLHYPETKNIFRFSGAVGFDKYKILKHKAIEKKNYKKVIGYAAFDFHNIILKKERLISEHGQKVYDNLMSLLDLSSEILNKLVCNNPDILFLIKSHPGDGEGTFPLEIEQLDKKDNLLVLEKETGIVDAIGNSDIWLNINSSTNLEAWLMNKPSISFLTDNKRFSSDVLFGSLTEDRYELIQEYIDEYYSTGLIREFENKKSTRKKLISDYIGFSDGFNHVRLMSFLKKYVEGTQDVKLNNIWQISLSWRIKSYLQHLLYTFSSGKFNFPFFKKWSEYYAIYNRDEFKKTKNKYYTDMNNFYKLHDAKIKDIYENFYKES